MQTLENTILDKQNQLVSLFKNSNETELKSILENPSATLSKIGFEIDENYINQIKECLNTAAFNLTASKNATIPVKKGRSRAAVSNDGISFSAQPWGLVLELDEATTQKVIAGINISAGVLAAAGSVASAFAAPVSVVAGVYSGFLAVYAGVISLVNNGNGIYLTLTWPQIAFITIALPVPIPTPR
jgi:hypothetical protein